METLCIFLFFAVAALIATIFWPFETPLDNGEFWP